MATPCQTCGDGGFPEALIFCQECQAYAVHRYCLHVLPATFDEFVVWLCEDCGPEVEKSSFLGKFSQDRENDLGNFGSVKVKKRNRVHKWKKKSKRKVYPCTLTKSRVLDEKDQEIVREENSEKDQEIVRQNRMDESGFDEVVESHGSESSQLDVHDCQLLEMNCRKDGKKDDRHGRQHHLNEGNFHEEAERLKTQNSPVAIPLKVICSEHVDIDQKVERWNGLHEECFSEEAARLNGSGFNEGGESPETKNTRLDRCDIHPLDVDPLKDGENNCKLGRQNNLDEGSSCEEAEPCITNDCQLVVSYSPNIVVHAQPIKDPIWRGSLNLVEKKFGTVSGLVAHVSSIACAKVIEEAKSLPALLSPELLPRVAVWPKGFAKSGPNDNSIALYFFPDSERNEKVFDSLVNDMISKELAMRVDVQNAELLIFTSRILPMEFWRFQAKFYLWGVFKGKQTSKAAVNAISGEEKGPMKALAWDRRSPVSPLSDGSYGCGSM